MQETTREINEKILKAYAEKARRHFRDYCLYVDHTYETPPHIDIMTAALEQCEQRKIKRIIFTLPPRHGKSTTVTDKFPSWYLGKHPDHNIIESSYSYSLIKTYSRKVRDTIESTIYKTIFPIQTRDDARAVNDWCIAGHKGGLLATGVGGGATGFGANVYIIDDPFKDAEEAYSETIREKVYDWYLSVVKTRLEPDAIIILIMTRWHQDDLVGRILKQEKEQWTVINMEALCSDKKKDPLNRSVGEALWPKRYDSKYLEQTKVDVGSRVWSSLFQGQPQDPASQIFKREWIDWYDDTPLACTRGGGIDTATSKATTADNMALVDVCKAPDKFMYVDDAFCEKLSVRAFAEHVCNQHKIKHYRKIHLEGNNAGEAIKQRIDEIGRELEVTPPVVAVPTATDKVIRAFEFQAKVENKTLKFKRGNKKVAELVEHLISFDGKGGDIDDDVDALGFAIKAVTGSDSLVAQEKRREAKAAEEHRPVRTPLVTAKSMSNW